MWANPQFPAELVTFTEEILNGKLHFLCSVRISSPNFWSFFKFEKTPTIFELTFPIFEWIIPMSNYLYQFLNELFQFLNQRFHNEWTLPMFEWAVLIFE